MDACKLHLVNIYYESNEVQLSHINVMLIAFYISAS